MEAPERIYFSTQASHPFFGLTRKWLDDDIEYVRLDAFVDKAATWFANRYQSNGSYLCANDIEDFVKYMKGE